MNSVKNLALMVLLAGAAYVAYEHISGGGASEPPPGAPSEAAEVPKVEVPGMDRAGLAPPRVAEGGRTIGTEAPPFMPGKMDSASDPLPAPGREIAVPSRAAGFDAPRSNLGAESRPWAETLSTTGPSREGAADRVTASAEAPAGPEDDVIREPFIRCMEAAHAKLARDEFTDVLTQLSEWHNHPDLTPAEGEKLVELLDQLAGSVIYSREHLLAPAHVVKPGDTLPEIARANGVPWELLAKINGVRDPNALRPEEEIKVVPGPFHAVIRLADRELTLLLQGKLYAGRFAIEADSSLERSIGSYQEYEVLRKSPAEPDAPGEKALELSDGVTLCGPDSGTPTAASRGTIRLGRRDIGDVCDILSVGSRVVIVR